MLSFFLSLDLVTIALTRFSIDHFEPLLHLLKPAANQAALLTLKRLQFTVLSTNSGPQFGAPNIGHFKTFWVTIPDRVVMAIWRIGKDATTETDQTNESMSLAYAVYSDNCGC